MMFVTYVLCSFSETLQMCIVPHGEGHTLVREATARTEDDYFTIMFHPGLYVSVRVHTTDFSKSHKKTCLVQILEVNKSL